jgi:hypothetical protein
MDRRLFDIIWEVYRDVDGKQPIQIISAYRSPATNAMLRRRSSGVARFSQHMQGHAMDFFIPNVPLEQIRFAGLRLQRGGVGFYPTSGSPFVHLDTGNIRHWPRMTHDQLARVFPDGRTVHVPTDGKPLKGYELALADIRKRGDEADAPSKSKSFLASLFGRKQSDDDDEGAASDAAGSTATVTAAAATTAAPDAKTDAKPTGLAKLAEIIPLPRSKPKTAGTYQVAAATSTPVSLKEPAETTTAEASEPTVVDVINARGIWDNASAENYAPPAQVAALKRRGAQAAADPQPTASLPENVSDAMAYAPPTPPLDRSQIVAASAPVSPRARTASLSSNPLGTSEALLAKTQSGAVAKMVRVKTAQKTNDIWLRAMIVTPSASKTLTASTIGDQDMTVMRAHFVKPNTAVAMTFSDDPQMGVVCEQFTGSAIATLPTTSFAMRTASLR